MLLSEIHQKILARNAQETTPFLSVHEANATLLNQIDALQLKCETLERDSSSQVLLDDMTPGGRGLTHAALKNETRLRDKLEKLQEELNHKLKEHSETSASALKIAKELSFAKDLNTTQEASILKLKHDNDQKDKVIEHITAELDEAKNSRRLAELQYEGLKETIRGLQEENDALKKENRQLVDRLISGKEQTSDEVNNLNTMVEHLKNELDMLRTLKVQDDKRRNWFGKSAVPEEKHMKEGTESSGPSTRKFGALGIVVPQSPKFIVAAHRGEATSVRYDATGADLVATASSDATVKVWDTSTGVLRATLMGTTGHVITACDISGGVVAGGGSDKMCRVWNLSTQRMLHQLIGHANKITCVRLFGDEKAVITGSADRSMKIWDISRKTYRQTVTLRHSSTSSCVDVASDACTVVSGHVDGGLRFWDARTGDKTAEIAGLHEAGITSVQFHPTIMTQVLTTGKDSTLKVVDIQTCVVLQTMSHDNYRVNYTWSSCSFSPDGVYAGAASSSTGDVFVWRTLDASLVTMLSGHTKSAVGFAWGRGGISGQQVATVDRGGTLILWA